MRKTKILMPILGISAIGTGVVPVVTSCSSATKIVPIDLLNIVGQTLKGFKKDADVSKYDTLVIPEGIKIIDDEAFKDVFVVGTKSGFINQIVMPTTLTQIKSKAFSGCNSLRVLDFSKWTVDHIYYATFANDAFEGAVAGGQTIFHEGISSKSKEKLTSMLANTGVWPSWSLDESTDKITPDSIWPEQRTKLGKADYLFRLNVELKSSYRLVATVTYTSGTEGISVIDSIPSTTKFLEIDNSIVKVPVTLLNHLNAGDFANFKITFTCVDIEAQKPIWKQSLKGFKLTNDLNIATELNVECDKTTIDEGKTTTIKATVGKESAGDKTVRFESSDDSVATVDANGVVTGVKHGTATISVIANGGLSLVKKIDINVKQVDFLTCSWEEINVWCNKLENGEIDSTRFCDHFLNGNEIIGTIDDFVGLERSVQINGQTHIVRVIGTQHDTIANTDTKAALTFEMVTLLSDSNGNAMTSKWDANDNYDYTNSILRWNLNGAGSGTKPSTGVWDTSAYSMLPSELQSIIKPVTKEVSINQTKTSGSDNYKIKTYNDKLFPLTCYEMGKYIWPQFEGSSYQYWSNHYESSDKIKKDANGNAGYYWLVSPCTSTDLGDKPELSVWDVHNDGEIAIYNGGIGENDGVSFAFCI